MLPSPINKITDRICLKQSFKFKKFRVAFDKRSINMGIVTTVTVISH